MNQLLCILAFVLASGGDRERNTEPSDQERRALDQLASEVRGAIVYARKGRIYKVTIGDWRPVELGSGQFVRWNRDGQRLAVYDGGAVFVMSADGSDRRKLCEGVDLIDDIPIAFHPDGRRVVFTRKKTGLWSVDVTTGDVRQLQLPDAYTGEMRYAADGRRLATRVGRELFAVDIETGTQRKYAFGCSPSLSPDGRRLMNNVGGHKTLKLQDWDGSNERSLDTSALSPDREWNNHLWSNHVDFIMAQGENGGGESYVVKVSENRPTRVTWHGKTSYPDLFVSKPAPRSR